MKHLKLIVFVLMASAALALLGAQVQIYSGQYAPGSIAIGDISTSAISTWARGLVDDADAAAARTTLGLGTAATADTGDFTGGPPFEADDWTHQWVAADGNPTSVGWSTFNVTASAPSLASGSQTDRTGASISCWNITPGAGTGSSGIKITWGSGATGPWELRARAWIPGASTSTWGFGYNMADNGTNEWAFINPKVAGVNLYSTALDAAAGDMTGAWVDWTLRAFPTKSGTGILEIWAGPVQIDRVNYTALQALRVAGEVEFGKMTGASVAAGCLAYIKLKDDGVNDAPPWYTFRAQGTGP